MPENRIECAYTKVEVKVPPDEILVTLGYDTEVNEGSYLIEAIQGICIINGQVRYKIKWLNWEDMFSTWEPIGHLTDCAETLALFHTKLKDKLSEGPGKKSFPIWWNYVSCIDKRGFSCTKCFKMLSSRFSLQRHKKFIHNRRNLKIKCLECKEEFKNQQSLETHKRQVCNQERIQCKTCATHILPKFMKSHVNGKHYGRRVKCDVYGSRLWNKNLSQHMKTQHM